MLKLTMTHKRILDLLVEGVEREEVAKRLKISESTLYSYTRDMNKNNDCNIYQLVYKYAQMQKSNLDLNELERKIDIALGVETTESLNNWINTKRNNKSIVDWIITEIENDKRMNGMMIYSLFKDKIEQAKKMEEELEKALVVGTFLDLKMGKMKIPYGMRYLNKLDNLEGKAEEYYKEYKKKKL